MSTDNGGGRRYSDEEFAVIRRRASEIQEGPSGSGGGGLTLYDIQRIAKEAGIDPAAVARAAAALPTDDPNTFDGIFGGPFAHRLDRTVQGEISEGDMHRVIRVLRRVTGRQGETEYTLNGAEWTGFVGTSAISVNISSAHGETTIEIVGYRSLTGVATYFTLVITSLVAWLLSLVALDPGTMGGPLVLSMLGAWLGAAFLASRTLLKRTSATPRRLLSGLMEEASRCVAEALGRGGPPPRALERREGSDLPAEPDS